MANLFVTDNRNNNFDDTDLDLDTCLEHPRVTKVTILPDGTLIAEMVASDEIIRKDNEGLHKRNKTGFRGVSVCGSKYRASVSQNGIQTHLGTFDTLREAIEARMKAEGAT